MMFQSLNGRGASHPILLTHSLQLMSPCEQTHFFKRCVELGYLPGCCVLLQLALIVGSSTIWPKVAACTSAAPSVGTSSAVAATTPITRWEQLTTSQNRITVNNKICASTLHHSWSVTLLTLSVEKTDTVDSCFPIHWSCLLSGG